MSDLKKFLSDIQNDFRLAERFRSTPEQVFESYGLAPMDKRVILDGGMYLLVLLHDAKVRAGLPFDYPSGPQASDVGPKALNPPPPGLSMNPPPPPPDHSLPHLNVSQSVLDYNVIAVKVWPVGGKVVPPRGKATPNVDSPSIRQSILDVKKAPGAQRYEKLITLMEGLSNEILG
jgi:hypothetical protein